MKKIVLASALASSLAFGDVVTILPYGGMIDYDSSDNKSAKDKSTLLGAHASMGNMEYLLEFDYAHLNTEYKDSDVDDLDQDDITLAYGKYFEDFMFRIGLHYINTNDDILDDGTTLITALGGYTWDGYDKYSYGVEGYYSRYSDGQDENDALSADKTINIVQFTPYLSFYKYFNKDMTNTVVLKVSYEIAPDYEDDSYTSFEIADTFGYKNFFTTLKYYGGEMRSGVRDGGFTVFNTLDLIKDGYDLKLGYYITPKAVVSLKYGRQNYEEYSVITEDMLDEGTYSVTVATFSYTF
jgi:hypothetical protein